MQQKWYSASCTDLQQFLKPICLHIMYIIPSTVLSLFMDLKKRTNQNRHIYISLAKINLWHCQVQRQSSLQNCHFLFAKVFFKPLRIFPNHTRFITASVNGTVYTKRKPTMCIFITCKQLDGFYDLLGSFWNLFCNHLTQYLTRQNKNWIVREPKCRMSSKYYTTGV